MPDATSRIAGAPTTSLRHARGELLLGHCLVMGIVNRTPDSFYDGGRTDLDEAVDHALRLQDEGADVLDLGGVRAGPGPVVGEGEEIERLLPLVERVAAVASVPISVETASPAVAARALDAGAALLNDVTALADPRLADACADAGAALVCMHHGGQLRGRPINPRYEDVVADVKAHWATTIGIAVRSGVERDSIVVDPGLDFGKTTFHSLELMRRIDELVAFGYPVLVAASRKDVVGETLDLPLQERLEGSLALACLAAAGGAAFVRAHDVRATKRVVAMTEAVMERRAPVAPVRGLWE